MHDINRGNIYFVYSNDYINTNNEIKTIVASIATYGRINMEIVENQKIYCKKHGYDYFLLRKLLPNPFNSKYTHFQDHLTQSKTAKLQKPTLLNNLMFNWNYTDCARCPYDRILWMDFDAIFYNHSVTIDDTINNGVNSKYTNLSNITDVSDVSLMLTGEFNYRINSGVLLFYKTSFIKYLFKKWHFILQFTSLRDQAALAYLLFNYQKITNLYNLFENNNIDNSNIIKQLDTSSPEFRKFDENIYHQINSIDFQINELYLQLNNTMSNDVNNNILFTEPIKMNANVHFLLNNFNILNLWIIHLAGDHRFNINGIRKEKYELINLLLAYRSSPTKQKLIQLLHIFKHLVTPMVLRPHCKGYKAAQINYAIHNNVTIYQAMKISKIS